MVVSRFSLCLTASLFLTSQVDAQTKVESKEVETIEVKSRVQLLRSDLDSLMSSTLIEQEQLDLMQSSSLGETLKMTPGIHANYFGPSSSSPIIRGLDGARIKIMQNGLDSGDASRLSPDHQVSSETSSATQIEILRGPATLLHGSGAIGGVVNVIDQRIPSQLVEEASGDIQASLNSGDNEKSANANIRASHGNFAFYGDAFVRDADETTIPQEHRKIENSQAKGHGITLGSSYIEDDFRFGISFGSLTSTYGLIGHDEHHEDEHHEDEHHEDEHHEDEHHEDEHHDELLPYVDTKQQRIALQSHWYNLPLGISEISLKMAHTDYQLQEIEHEHIATQVDNVSSEVKLQLHHQWIKGWQGVAGVHWQTSDMEPIGEEASSAPAISESTAIYATSQRQFEKIKWHVGARVEHVKVTPELEIPNVLDSVSFHPVSWSTGLNWQVNSQHSVLVNLNHSQRALSAAELFSFGEHLGTSTFDVGAYFTMASDNGNALYKPSSEFNLLDTEDANTVDLGWQFNSESFSFASSLYYSDVSNFAYQEFVELAGDGLPIYQYQQAGVTVRGAELQLNYFVNDNLAVNVFADATEIRLKSGGYLPRVPPTRIGSEVVYELQDWQFMLNASYYAKQSKIAVNETVTKGYTLLGFNITKQQQFKASQLKYYFKVNNLLDESAQVHSSFIKEQAPLPGISAKLGVRWSF